MRCVALVPTYENLRTLPRILEELEAAGFEMIVVDDGSRDGTAEWLAVWSREGTASGRVRRVVRFAVNKGKGAALDAGLRLALDCGFDVACTVDSDGQHRAEDAARVRDAARGGVLVLGARSDNVARYPLRSLVGRRLWSLGVRALTGRGISDPICGLRAYPLRSDAMAVAMRECVGGGFVWEEEFLVRALWHHIEVEEVDIATIYLPVEERVSHFKWRDWWRSMRMFLRLSGQALVHRRAPSSHRRTRCRERSWRWMVGAEVLIGGVGGSIGAAIDPVIGAWCTPVLLAFIAWRLHATGFVAFGAAILGGWIFGGAMLTPASSPTDAGLLHVVASIPAFSVLAFVATRAARFLGSS